MTIHCLAPLRSRCWRLMTGTVRTRGGGHGGGPPGLAVLAMMALLTSSCLVMRLARPAYEGFVVDSKTRAPLPGVSVGFSDVSRVTDAQGKFAVPAVTYHEMTWIGGEAPHLHFNFSLRKDGYCERLVEHFSRFGGAAAGGSAWREIIPLIPVSNGPCPPRDGLEPVPPGPPLLRRLRPDARQ
jgi:hypothetical protein